jgi:hypothetical protein
MSGVRPLAALVESDDKVLFPHTKKIKGNFADVETLKTAVATKCALQPDEFELQYYDMELSEYVDLSDLDCLDDMGDESTAGGKRKRTSEHEESSKKIKLKLVAPVIQPNPAVVASSDEIDGLRVKELREHLQHAGLDTTGLKGTLTTRLKEHRRQSTKGEATAAAASSACGKETMGGETMSEEITWHLAPLAHEDEPSLSRPTLVYATFVLDQLGDIDTARCVVYVRMTLTMYWHDPRLKHYHKLGSPLPETLWGPNPRVKEEILGNFEVRVLEFTRMQEPEHEGDIYMVVSYGGTITNPMDLHLFPFDYDDIEITFLVTLLLDIPPHSLNSNCPPPHPRPTPASYVTGPQTLLSRRTTACSSSILPPLQAWACHPSELQNSSKFRGFRL